MNHRSIDEIAKAFGLSIETVPVPDHERALRVYKGANQVFVGTEEAVRDFLVNYGQSRPAPFEGSIYGYRE